MKTTIKYYILLSALAGILEITLSAGVRIVKKSLLRSLTDMAEDYKSLRKQFDNLCL